MMMWRKCFSRRRNIRRWQKRCGKRYVSLHNPQERENPGACGKQAPGFSVFVVW